MSAQRGFAVVKSGFEKLRLVQDNFLNGCRGALSRRGNIHVVNQHGQRLRVSDGADDHRFGASADRNFLPR